ASLRSRGEYGSAGGEQAGEAGRARRRHRLRVHFTDAAQRRRYRTRSRATTRDCEPRTAAARRVGGGGYGSRGYGRRRVAHADRSDTRGHFLLYESKLNQSAIADTVAGGGGDTVPVRRAAAGRLRSECPRSPGRSAQPPKMI